MHKKSERVPEITVEAGSAESLLSAIEAGADAVAIELEGTVPYPSENAFSISDYPDISELARLRGIKLCLLLDWAYKDSDIKKLAKIFETIKRHLPQRVIVGDIGIARFISQNYPISISSGSLLSAHNAACTSFLARQNFSLVRVNPLLTRHEISRIARKANCKLSMQVHGDLCFSFRELCYASSFFTNRSALRQTCQPVCRRLYMANGKLGYWLSTRDLELIEHLDWLKELGIKEFFIRGFSRPAEYVYQTAKAYRMVRDASKAELGDAIEEAKRLLALDLGRSKTQAFLGGFDKRCIVDPQRPPVAGLFIGRIESISNGMATVMSKSKLNEGDRLKIVSPSFEEGPSFGTHALKIKEIEASTYLISFKVPKTANINDFVFKISSQLIKNPRASNATSSSNAAKPLKDECIEKSVKEKLNKVYSALERFTKRGEVADKPVYRIEIWGKLKPQIRIPPNAELVVDLRESVEDISEDVKRRVILSLPPVILESEWPIFQMRVEALLKEDFRRWQIGHFSQIEIFKRAQKWMSDLSLTCGPTCNVFNLLCAATMWDQGVQLINLPYEVDCELIEKFNDELWRKKFGVTVYGFVPLMTSRVSAFESATPLSLFGRDWAFKAFPKKFTTIRPPEPFYAPSTLLKGKLSNFAFLQIQLDSTVAAHSIELNTIVSLIKKAKWIGKTNPFNLIRSKKI